MEPYLGGWSPQASEDLAFSALPDAPVQPDAPADDTGGHGLRRHAAETLARLAERLEPDVTSPDASANDETPA